MKTQVIAVPPVPLTLGLAGVVPFLFLSGLSWFQGPYQAPSQFALMTYGVVILTFVGALHWAFAMIADGLSERERVRHYLWSVVPALLGWIALLLPPASTLILLLMGFWSHFLLDRQLVARATLPGWYLPLRLGLTLTASLALLAALGVVLA
jgi:hypothetical protein